MKSELPCSLVPDVSGDEGLTDCHFTYPSVEFPGSRFLDVESMCTGDDHLINTLRAAMGVLGFEQATSGSTSFCTIANLPAKRYRRVMQSPGMPHILYITTLYTYLPSPSKNMQHHDTVDTVLSRSTDCECHPAISCTYTYCYILSIILMFFRQDRFVNKAKSVETFSLKMLWTCVLKVETVRTKYNSTMRWFATCLLALKNLDPTWTQHQPSLFGLSF